MRKKLRLIHRNKKRSRCLTGLLRNDTGLFHQGDEVTASSAPPFIDILPDIDTGNLEVTGEIIMERGPYRLVKEAENDFQCMKRRPDGRYISHRSFENLLQAEFHFNNEHE
jgi:hypothetical protein